MKNISFPALFQLQFVSGLCMNLVSMDSFIRNTTLPETTRDPTGKLSRQELVDNNEQPTRARRIFKVVPVKTNQRWNKKFSVIPELRGMSQDVPVAIIVAAKTDLRNLKVNNESNVNNTESKTRNVEVENDSHITSSSPYEDNSIEKDFLSNLGQSVIGNFQNIVTKAAPHVEDDSKEVDYESKDIKEANRIDDETENEDSKERTVENSSDLEALKREPLENEDVETSVTSVTSEHLCNISENNLEKPKCRTDHNEFDIHKYMKKIYQDPRKRDFNVFFILKK